MWFSYSVFWQLSEALVLIFHQSSLVRDFKISIGEILECLNIYFRIGDSIYSVSRTIWILEMSRDVSYEFSWVENRLHLGWGENMFNRKIWLPSSFKYLWTYLFENQYLNSWVFYWVETTSICTVGEDTILSATILPLNKNLSKRTLSKTTRMESTVDHVCRSL